MSRDPPKTTDRRGVAVDASVARVETARARHEGRRLVVVVDARCDGDDDVARRGG